MTASRYERVRQVLARRQPDLTVVMENVHKPHNLAAIARSADAVGVAQVHAVAVESGIELTQKSASGASKWVGVKSHRSLQPLVDELHADGYQTLAMTIDEHALDYREIDYTGPTAVVVGAELEGLSEQAVRSVRQSVYIPMLGMVESLNVSVATALVLFEARRQREAAGLYKSPRIAPEEYERLVFEWCQPVIARYCRRHGLAYPPLDEDGDVVGGIEAVVPIKQS